MTSNGGVDRTLRTIFTHDHFGPSTHQQVGLYAGLLVEPDGSQWQEPVTGTFLGTDLGRPVGANGQTIDDGGPTSWQANILTANTKDSYREFALEFQDRQLGYKSSSLSPAQRKPLREVPDPQSAVHAALGLGRRSDEGDQRRRWRRTRARRRPCRRRAS